MIAEEVSATIVYFHDGDADIDVDNIAKPVLDALVDLVYLDDFLVAELTIRRTALAAGLTVRDPSPDLSDALVGGRDFVYVRIADGPDHEVLP